VKLFSKYSNPCDHNTPTLQTDGQTTYHGNTTLRYASRGKNVLVVAGMTKYITGRTGLTGAIVDTSPAVDVCKYYIGLSVACLSVLSSAAADATQRRADRRRQVYDTICYM